ncbi:hypothetical protein SAMN05428944_1646 [Streptomyces sp. 1222.5]|uniref:hypothetical protein n=1 Tax=unclassified Streptomyces TaxID=2593676 RepID=UPI0008989DC3|nr:MULTISPECIES: hypothetical protein [unclassified Streptomyces]PKW11140.1 hypothetical protein BX260_6446 [Streptomyces sp. 5112.2]SEB87020.1 hypothetical protein SAMN05428944_1646 [Streptomyces sp. 1222.5]
MTTEYHQRSNFVFAPPTDNPAAWQASLETFRDALERDFPGAFLEANTSALRDLPVLDFEIQVAPDVYVTGTSAMPTVDYAYISVIEATPDEAAAFAVWLRDSYVPSPASVCFMSSFVMENGDEMSWRLPATGDATGIAAVMREHLAAAGGE